MQRKEVKEETGRTSDVHDRAEVLEGKKITVGWGEG